MSQHAAVKTKPLKVLWAIDALDPLSKTIEKTTKFFEEIGKTVELDIHPVFALGPQQIGLAVEFASPVLVESLIEGAKKALENSLSNVRVRGLKKPETLIHQRPSLRGTVQRVADYASQLNVDWVVLGTHARTGTDRALFGSFTEEFLFHSKKPVVVIGPDTEINTGPEKRILMPNDMSDIGTPFFVETFNLARSLSAKPIYLNAIPKPLEVFLESGVYLFSGAWISIPSFIHEESAKMRLRADQLKALAKQYGVECETVIDQGEKQIVESILHQAKVRNVSLIAIAAKSGPLRAALIGSITRKIIRQAPCPVWVYPAN